MLRAIKFMLLNTNLLPHKIHIALMQKELDRIFSAESISSRNCSRRLKIPRRVR